MSKTFAERLVATLPIGRPGLFNPWREGCHFDTEKNSKDSKLERLARHLDCDARLILVGEAPGYQGCRYSGIAFTSERLLIEGVIPRIPQIGHRLSKRERPFSEPSATIVWKTLYQLGLAEKTILWNAVQLHPFKPNTPWSNRTPTDAELAYGGPALRLLREFYPNAKVVAVGQKAAGVLQMQNIPFEATVRHPANGGATLFAKGVTEVSKTV